MFDPKIKDSSVCIGAAYPKLSTSDSMTRFFLLFLFPLFWRRLFARGDTHNFANLFGRLRCCGRQVVANLFSLVSPCRNRGQAEYQAHQTGHQFSHQPCRRGAASLNRTLLHGSSPRGWGWVSCCIQHWTVRNALSQYRDTLGGQVVG